MVGPVEDDTMSSKGPRDLNFYIQSYCRSPEYRNSDLKVELAPHFTSPLRSTGINRVVLYPGCFNPPHVGHLNIVAAIVHPKMDLDKGKQDDLGPSISFTQEEKRRLWLQDPEFPVWGGVLDQQLWPSFANHIEEEANQDGFQIKFINLCGAEYAEDIGENPTNYYEEESTGPSEYIISNQTRETDHVFRSHPPRLQTIRNFSLWEPLHAFATTFDSSLAPKHPADQILVNRRGGKSNVPLVADTLVRIHFCTHRGLLTVIFVPKDEHSCVGLSSTAIRNMIQESSMDLKDIPKNPEVARLVLGPHRRVQPVSPSSKLSCLTASGARHQSQLSCYQIDEDGVRCN
ncbi:hypothetical protein E6O75_ATG00594 [Venturia nashicola]|uniref:Cytidyltransferase-like domain-containing protein n=1 Tax=Venturia nashicola TaxID=86259 RepID=A0A4Z1PIS8_9PEZI|nr:hypothetical protein E6O75_ATG00594 [Venturia nashicola]